MSSQPITEGAAAPETKTPPILFERTQALVARIEQALKCRLISYWNADNGSVCTNDLVALYELFQRIGKQKQVALFLKSRGGDVEAALRVVHLIRHYCEQVTAIVPLECASAATMVALGADRILMGPLAHLTAVDSSLTHDLSPLNRENNRVSVSQDELTRIVRLWTKSAHEHHGNPYTDIFQHVHPLVVGAIDRSSSLSVKVCQEILSYHIADEARAGKISEQLNSAYPSHSYPITLREAKRLGLSVDELDAKLNDDLLELNEFYSEMGQRAVTNFDQFNQHDNSILNILEANEVQVLYQNNKDWHYLKEERRWVTMNDESAWRTVRMIDGKLTVSRLHIA